jgi:hypothetical protein
MNRPPVDRTSGESAAGAGGPAGRSRQSDRVYTYQSAGIGERKGRVPAWLWVVAVLLVIWGLYYLIRYWNPPA